MATYTPEQIREYTKGMSDKEIADAAQQFGVSAGQLATAFNTTEDVIKDRAKAAGADLTVSSKPDTPPRPAPKVGVDAMDYLAAGTKSAPVTPVMPDPSKYGIQPTADLTTYMDQISDAQQQAKDITQGTLEAGIPQYLADQYAAGNIDAVNKVIADSGMTAQQIATQFNMTPGDLQYLANQGVVASGLPSPQAPETPQVPDIPEVADVSITSADGTEKTYQYGSQVNDDLANAYFNAQQTGNYEPVNQMLISAGYTLDDVKNQFNLTDESMQALKDAGIVGVSEEDGVLADLFRTINDLTLKNQDATGQVQALNNIINGLGLTMEDLQAKFNLTPDGVAYLNSLNITGYQPTGPTIEDAMMQRATNPMLPQNGQMTPQGIAFDAATQAVPTGTGSVGTAPTMTGAPQAGVQTVAQPSATQAAQYQAEMASDQLQQTTAAVGSVSAPMQAQTMVPTSTEVANQQAAQIDQAVRIQAPDARQLSAEELVSAPADAQVASQFAEQVQAAQAQPTPEATVQGQLANMMAQFEGGQTPPWAAGAMRNATAIMAQRGLGASSMAGQAIIQAAMESALPIAVQDAQTMAQFEMQNLSNRQARAMLAAQQRAQFIGQEFDQEFQARVQNASRVADIANLNFSAEQQIALENAQLAQTVDLANLSNRQAVQMANIAQIANLETTNLNNRQQAAVQNAQSFLQMDMANLSNQQQAVMFDAQSRVQTLLSDQAAENASRQFNASSQQQTDQFFANLASQVSQFNATQTNAMAQFNVEQENAISKFNTEIQNERDQFNAQNELIVAQSNAQWRREIATADTLAANAAAEFNAKAVLDISEQAYANMWQTYEDMMEYSWRSGENEMDRINNLATVKLQADANLSIQELRNDAQASAGVGKFIGTVASGFIAKEFNLPIFGSQSSEG